MHSLSQMSVSKPLVPIETFPNRAMGRV